MEPPERWKPAPPADSHAARVFLAEDDHEIRTLIASVLRREGHEVIEASQGHDLLRRVRSRQPSEADPLRDIVVTAVRMPSVRGLNLLADLRRLQPTIPVLIVTGYGDAGTASASEIGAAAASGTPFSLAELIKTVLRLASWGSSLCRPANCNGAP